MSNISRRDFLKTAGVMTLAVAAAGVLAGCEGNNNNEQLPEITPDSAKIGDYTVTLTGTKQYSVKKYNEDGTVKEEMRHVIAVFNILNSDPTQTSVPGFGIEFKADNMTRNNLITDKAVKKLFDLPVLPGSGNPDMNKVVPNATATGSYYFMAYNVDYTDDAEGVRTFKDPAFRIVLNDTKGEQYHKLVATIPAATPIKDAELRVE